MSRKIPSTKNMTLANSKVMLTKVLEKISQNDMLASFGKRLCTSIRTKVTQATRKLDVSIHVATSLLKAILLIYFIIMKTRLSAVIF
jgi:hypothetical protein